MIKPKELKTKIYLTHSLILSPISLLSFSPIFLIICCSRLSLYFPHPLSAEFFRSSSLTLAAHRSELQQGPRGASAPKRKPPTSGRSPANARARARRAGQGPETLPDAFKAVSAHEEYVFSREEDEEHDEHDELRLEEPFVEEELWRENTMAVEQESDDDERDGFRNDRFSADEEKAALEAQVAQLKAELKAAATSASAREFLQMEIPAEPQQRSVRRESPKSKPREVRDDMPDPRLVHANASIDEAELNRLIGRLGSSGKAPHIANPVESPVAARLANARAYFHLVKAEDEEDDHEDEFDRWDHNADGVIDREEFAAVLARTKEKEQKSGRMLNDREEFTTAIAKAKLDASGVSAETQQSIKDSLMRHGASISGKGKRQMESLEEAMENLEMEMKTQPAVTPPAVTVQPGGGFPQAQLTMFGLEAAASLDRAMGAHH